MENISTKKIEDFVISLRKMQFEIEKKQAFCREHNFEIEAKVKFIESERVRVIIQKMEDEFDLGFVWDKSLNG